MSDSAGSEIRLRALASSFEADINIAVLTIFDQRYYGVRVLGTVNHQILDSCTAASRTTLNSRRTTSSRTPSTLHASATICSSYGASPFSTLPRITFPMLFRRLCGGGDHRPD